MVWLFWKGVVGRRCQVGVRFGLEHHSLYFVLYSRNCILPLSILSVERHSKISKETQSFPRPSRTKCPGGASVCQICPFSMIENRSLDHLHMASSIKHLPVIDISSPTPESCDDLLRAASEWGFLYVRFEGLDISEKDVNHVFNLVVMCYNE